MVPQVAIWIASRSLSSGARSRDPLARNDDERGAATCLVIGQLPPSGRLSIHIGCHLGE